MGPNKGSGSLKLKLPEQKPISGEVSYNANLQENVGKVDGSAVFTYGDNRKFQMSGNVQCNGETEISGSASVKTDYENAKDITLQFSAKRPSGTEVASKINLNANGQQYSVDYEHQASQTEPKFILTVVRPQGTSKIHAEAQIISLLKGTGSLALENIETFNLDANIDADLTSLENFYLKGEINSPTLSINKYVVDVKSRDGPAGRAGFDFKITKDGKHLLSGSTDFTTKMDKGRTIFEGKSTVKLSEGEKADEVSFKLIRNVFEGPRDGESGFGAILNVFVGPRTYAGELKLTDKEFHAKYTGCATQNRCTNLETKSVLETSNIQDFKHNLIVSIDLRQVGFSHEFGFKADTSRDGWKFLHSADAYLQAQDKPDYQCSVYIQPTDAGASLTLPNRQVALDTSFKYPDRSVLGVYDATINFYMDKKNKPRQKTELGFKGELSKSEQRSISGKGDIKFQHPLVKPMRIGGQFTADMDGMDVKSKLEFDVFTNPMDKIVILGNFGNTDTSGRGFNLTSEFEMFSKGLGVNMKYHEHAGLSYERRLITIGSELVLPVEDFRFGMSASATDNSFEVFIIGFGQELLKSIGNYNFKEPNLSIETKLQHFGAEPCVFKSSLTGLTQGSFTMSKGNLLNVDSGFAVGKDIHLLVKGSGNEIFNGKIALDPKEFLTTTYKVNDAQMKTFSKELQDEIKKDSESAEKEVKAKCERVQQFWDQKLKQLLDATPDFTKFNQEHTQEVKKLIDELKQDESLRRFIDQAVNIVSELLKTFTVITQTIGEQVVAIEKIFTEYYQKATEAYKQNILPELEKLYQSLRQLVSDVYGQTVKMVTAVFERVAKALKAFEEDFNKIASQLKEISANTYEIIGKYIQDIMQELKELIELIKTQIESLPGVDYLKEKYDEIATQFNIIEQVKLVVQELLSSIVHVVPEKVKPLFEKIVQYLDKVTF